MVLGILVSLGAATGVIWGRVKPVKVSARAVWADTARVCPRIDVDLGALDEAIWWWRQRGYDIELGCVGHNVTVSMNPELDVRMSVQSEGMYHGITYGLAQDGVMVWADIELRPGVGSLAMAHELGHALGLLHARNPPSGHIMHPFRVGWDDRGVRVDEVYRLEGVPETRGNVAP